MSVYFDASVIVSLFAQDGNSALAARKAAQLADTAVVSDLGGAEFASAIAKRVRMKDLTAKEAAAAFTAFDIWSATRAERVELTPQDVAACAALLRRLDSPVRTPDALHIAIVRRIGARLFTFDAKMKACARKEGIGIV
jgi:hypothetical protein